MISTPSCSAPCKAFSLNSLPFSRTAAAHICGNQATATPPTRPERLPQPWSPCPKFPFFLQVRNLPTFFHSTCYFQDSAYTEGAELRSFPSGRRPNFALQNVSERGGWRAGGKEELLGSNPSSAANLLCDLGKATFTSCL
ncbi:hypothetical protein mRhiFer1_009314 [Rhinolophus ferrumequinum]|uniref:Uncharacterized protein n=1 Tax=Rhinolophus ferrumequinum TaxID=59479 RepID=A0A7J7RYE8_RHIFE|nr:hypothetical protein mRhiFer1_009314 [Rhinolophus ferrumequinum]